MSYQKNHMHSHMHPYFFWHDSDSGHWGSFYVTPPSHRVKLDVTMVLLSSVLTPNRDSPPQTWEDALLVMRSVMEAGRASPVWPCFSTTKKWMLRKGYFGEKYGCIVREIMHLVVSVHSSGCLRSHSLASPSAAKSKYKRRVMTFEPLECLLTYGCYQTHYLPASLSYAVNNKSSYNQTSKMWCTNCPYLTHLDHPAVALEIH